MSAGTPTEFTRSQRDAIEASGNVLVVAGAGTGKTRILVERCIRHVLDGGSLEGLLLVTFTEAAAAEMRGRVRTAIATRLTSDPGNRHLLEQEALLDSARISTLHAFCRLLIQEHFHELELDPQVVVLDERQTRPLIEQAVDAVLDARLSAPGDPLRDRLPELGPDPLVAARKAILRLHRYTQALPDPAGWIREQRTLFTRPHPDTWTAWLLEGVAEWCAEWLPRLAPRVDVPAIAAADQALKDFNAAKGLNGLGQVLEAIAAADTLWIKGTKGRHRPPFEALFEQAGTLRSLTRATKEDPDPMQTDWDRVRGLMNTLLDLAQEFDQRYTRAKRELGGVDFSDLEQLSLRLLLDAEGRPTLNALRCRQLFTQVFVDEVQDINGAQDAILRAVSGEGASANRFLVGDVKQSIYRFRLANPGIFQGYEARWRQHPAEGRVIDLTDNFRSREGVLAMINSLFATVMEPGLGGTRYDESARLRFGSPDTRAALKHHDGECLVELRVLWAEAVDDAPGEESETGPTAALDATELPAAEREARWIAHRLRALHAAGTPVWDDTLKSFRAVAWSDMVVLLRSPGAKVEMFAKEFHKAGIPLSAARGGFLEAREVVDLLGILQLLDNPLQDIPLLTVLRSPLGCFTLEELAALVGPRPRTRRPLWGRLLDWAHGRGVPPDAALQAKAAGFRDLYVRWREGVRLGSLSGCLETVLADTHYEAILEAEDRGRERLGNVRRLLDLARQFDPYQRQGLYRFLRFIETQQDGDVELAAEAAGAGDVVRLMSIHRSKGLEFPVVVVADLGKRFNERDLNDDLLFDEQMGLCPRAWAGSGLERYPSAAHWVARRRGRRELLGEELRLLYVALTRARDHLVLVGSGMPRDWVMPGGADEEPADAGSARSLLDWIRIWHRTTVSPAHWVEGSHGSHPLVRWRVGDLLPEETATSVPSLPRRTAPTPAPGPTPDAGESLEPVLRRLRWAYPHRPATVEPVKTTVSILKQREHSELDDTIEWGRPGPGGGSRGSRRTGGALTAAESGILHHTFLQFLDLSRTESLLDLHNEAARMQEEGVLSPVEVQALDLKAVADFWLSEAGQQVRLARHVAQRELSFTARLSAEDLNRLRVTGREGPTLDPGEFVVVQGQVDLALIHPREIWLLDFKTDHLPESELAGRVESYRMQVCLYALALERIYQRPVTRRWLHFLSLRRTVSLEPPA
jgi:ATP-dependent helicase/nuclease subunit A